MMKLNQTGENQNSVEKHLKEHYELLARWEKSDVSEERKQSLKDIIKGRQTALETLKDDKSIDMITTQTVLHS